jgi:hypothetical protein
MRQFSPEGQAAARRLAAKANKSPADIAEAYISAAKGSAVNLNLLFLSGGVITLKRGKSKIAGNPVKETP